MNIIIFSVCLRFFWKYFICIFNIQPRLILINESWYLNDRIFIRKFMLIKTWSLTDFYKFLNYFYMQKRIDSLLINLICICTQVWHRLINTQLWGGKMENQGDVCHHTHSLCKPVAKSTRKSVQMKMSSLPSSPKNVPRNGKWVWYLFFTFHL